MSLKTPRPASMYSGLRTGFDRQGAGPGSVCGLWCYHQNERWPVLLSHHRPFWRAPNTNKTWKPAETKRLWWPPNVRSVHCLSDRTLINQWVGQFLDSLQRWKGWARKRGKDKVPVHGKRHWFHNINCDFGFWISWLLAMGIGRESANQRPPQLFRCKRAMRTMTATNIYPTGMYVCEDEDCVMSPQGLVPSTLCWHAISSLLSRHIFNQLSVLGRRIPLLIHYPSERGFTEC